MKRRILSLVVVLQVALLVTAQEHPFLSKFQLTEGDSWVTVDWTMVAGGTCDGTRIMRSENGVDFIPVGMIEGLCGDIVQPVEYRYIDHTAPELATLFYQLELGAADQSSIQKIELQRLRTVQHRFQPSPVQDAGELVLKVGVNAAVEIHFFDAAGREVHRIMGRGERHPVNVQGWNAGLYFYRVVIDGQPAQGKFVVE